MRHKDLQGISSFELDPWCLRFDTALGFTIPIPPMFIFKGSINLPCPLLDVKSSGLRSSLVNDTELCPLTKTEFCMPIELCCIFDGLCRKVVESTYDGTKLSTLMEVSGLISCFIFITPDDIEAGDCIRSSYRSNSNLLGISFMADCRIVVDDVVAVEILVEHDCRVVVPFCWSSKEWG